MEKDLSSAVSLPRKNYGKGIDFEAILRKEISRFPMLTNEQEDNLFLELEDPATTMERREKIKSILVGSQLRYIFAEALRNATKEVPLMELFQEGADGLIRAIEKFDRTRGVRLHSYARWWIRQRMHMLLIQEDKPVRIPVSQIDFLKEINRAIKNISHHLGEEPNTEMLSEALGKPVSVIEDIISFSQAPYSLDKTFEEDDRSRTFGEALDLQIETEEKTLEEIEATKKYASKLIQRLSGIKREVIEMYFGLGDNQPHTLEEIGQNFGFSRERARQIKEKALRIMRPLSAQERERVKKEILR